MKKNQSDRKRLGYEGERIAVEYLEACGYDILARNYTVRGGEIDIIAYDSDYIVFVEVKTRKDDSFGRACEAVDMKKILCMIKAAERFLFERSDDENVKNRQPRFDVIEVYTQKMSISHIKNIDID